MVKLVVEEGGGYCSSKIRPLGVPNYYTPLAPRAQVFLSSSEERPSSSPVARVGAGSRGCRAHVRTARRAINDAEYWLPKLTDRRVLDSKNKRARVAYATEHQAEGTHVGKRIPKTVGEWSTLQKRRVALGKSKTILSGIVRMLCSTVFFAAPLAPSPLSRGPGGNRTCQRTELTKAEPEKHHGRQHPLRYAAADKIFLTYFRSGPLLRRPSGQPCGQPCGQPSGHPSGHF